jgi:hypothetical protein
MIFTLKYTDIMYNVAQSLVQKQAMKALWGKTMTLLFL